MNRKKVKRQKLYYDSSNDKDSSQEVLVLPPNLLEKLGINLGKMCVNQDSTVDSTEDVQNSKLSILNNEEKCKLQNNSYKNNESKNTNGESSIIETANLMKKSVFLSPTFTSQADGLSSNEIVDSTNKTEVNCTDAFAIKAEPNKNVNTNSKTDNLADIPGQRISDLEICTNLYNDEYHTDTNQIGKCKLNVKKHEGETNNKINILSEKVIDKEVMEFNILKPLIDLNDLPTLVPIPIDTFISINKISDAENKSLNSACKDDNVPESKNKDVMQTSKQIDLCDKVLENNTLKTQINDGSLNKPDLNEKSTETISSDKTFTKNLHNWTQEEERNVMPNAMDNIAEIKACNEPLENITQEVNTGFCCESVNNQHDSPSNNIQVDKVKTIANILSQHLKKDKTNNLNNFESSNSQEKFCTLKQNKVKSKLSVQGVEKPGGLEKLYQLQGSDIRTYARNKKADFHKRHTNDYHTTAVPEEIDYKTEADSSNIQNSQQFCICSDFGRLDYNTFAENYKHLHFGESENNSSPTLIFSIYDDIELNTMNYIDSNNFEETPDSTCNICYSSIKLDLANVISPEKTDGSIKEVNISLDVNEKCESICNDVKKCVNNESELEQYLNNKKESTELQTIYVRQTCGSDVENINVPETNCSENNINADTNITKKRKVSLSKKSEAGADGHNSKKPTKIVTCHICNKTVAETILENHISEDHNVTSEDNVAETSVSCENVPQVWDVPLLERPPKVEVTVPGVTCAVCHTTMSQNQWLDHLAREHKYLAWEEGQPSLDCSDKCAVYEHLVNICNTIGEVICNNCFVEYKNVYYYLAHIEECGSTDTTNKTSTTADNDKCAVCGQQIAAKHWIDHIAKEHNYLAWKVGQPKLDLKDDEAVNQHLHAIKNEIGELKCSKCGYRRKYVKSYLQHVKHCDDSLNETLSESTSVLNTTQECAVVDILDEDARGAGGRDVSCGVCGARVRRSKWQTHAQRDHAYLAWRDGQTPLDISNENDVFNHLRKILKREGELICRICNGKRRNVKSYLHHVEKCDKQIGIDKLGSSTAQANDAPTIKCGVCKSEIASSQWMKHIAVEHNYLGWKLGQPALDLADKNAVREHLLKICNKIGELACNNCKVQIKNVDGYLRHVKDCGDMDPFKKISKKNKDKKQKSEESSPVKCAVCDKELPSSKWTDHIAMAHNYVAWKVGEMKLDLNDDEAVHNHLYRISKDIGGLKCSKCGRCRKYVKSYLQHVETCAGLDGSILNTTDEIAADSSGDEVGGDDSEVTCGVCRARVLRREWQAHAQKEHAYLAWREGQQPLDVSNENVVYKHLRKVLLKTGELVCGTCNERRRYVKSYMQHVGKCDKSKLSFDPSDTLNQSAVSGVNSTLDGAPVNDSLGSDVGGAEAGEVTCGVCGASLPRREWRAHAHKQHAYLAWRKGEEPLKLDDEEEVNKHLYKINKREKGLKCNKCDKVRKYVKAYLSHVENCDTITVKAVVEDGILEAYECAVCSEKVEPSQWKLHAMKKHYNVAWIVGETPIDVKNPFAVEKYLKIYKEKYHKLACNVCGLVRVSYAGFYAHIIQCGKTDEETEMYKSVCDICDNKYLCIYKNQHMTMHREQENAKHRKLMQAEKQTKVSERDGDNTKRRKAAEKAKNVIENYNKDGTYKCPTCGFGTDEENELKEHVCKPLESVSDDDGSAHIDSASSSDDDSFESTVESDHSINEPKEKKKKKKHSDTIAAKVTRIPFKVAKPKVFLAESAVDFVNMYYTSDLLFPKWRTCTYECVSDAQLPQYVPLVTQSCQVMFDSDQWTTYLQFEARFKRGFSFFVGGSIQCIAWAPRNVNDEENPLGNFLAVASHRDADTPRCDVQHTYRQPNMIQIWDMEDLNKCLPRFVMGIAHDYGYVWAMDWCPSGARDILLDSDAGVQRLGLLAVACSSGSAYIFAVPYPSTITDGGKSVFKFQPVAELRLSRGEREIYQASSITWSMEKGHSLIIVGYADGIMASYNIALESPLLSDEKDGITIFYPFDEEQRHNSCITDLSTLPHADGGTACVSSASQTGATLRLRGAAVRSLLPAARAAFLPHWPAVVLAGNDTIVSQAVNELECWGAGRRLGSLQNCGSCWRCGAFVVCAPPALRLLHAHPAYADTPRKDIAMVQMRRLEHKTRKVKNDGLAVTIEPTTFEDAVKTYGLEFKFLTGSVKGNLHEVMANKEQCPERFPLADIVGMAFCPSAVNHRKLAVATHAGMIFVITV